MEKISRILPSSPRIASAEASDSQPFRPSAPSFGNVEGVSALSDRVSLSPKVTSQLEPQKFTTWKTKDEKNAAIAESVSHSFFMKGKAEPKTVRGEGQSRAQVADHAARMWGGERPSLKLEPAVTSLKPQLFSVDEAVDGDDVDPQVTYSQEGLGESPQTPAKGTQLSVKA